MNLFFFLFGFKSGYNLVVLNFNCFDGMFFEEQVVVICFNSGVLYGVIIFNGWLSSMFFIKVNNSFKFINWVFNDVGLGMDLLVYLINGVLKGSYGNIFFVGKIIINVVFRQFGCFYDIVY